MGNSFTAANTQILRTTTQASTNLTALEVKLNSLKQQRAVTLDLKDLARANREIQRVEERMEHLESMGRKNRAGGGGLGLGSVAAVGASAYGMVGMVQTTAKVEGLRNSISFAAGGGEKGAKSLQFVDDVTARLHLDSMAASEGYRTLAGSMMNTKLAGEPTQRMFEQVATATTVMNLTGEDAKGTFLALGQMMSKAKVSAEELNGQIGERIPGALGIAARAMKMPTAALMDLMKDGKVMSEDFLPKFAAQLQKEFGPGLAQALTGIQPQINDFNNEWLRTQTTFTTAVLPTITDVMHVLERMMKAVQAASGWLKEHQGVAQTLTVVVVGLGAAVLAYSTYTKAAAVGTAIWTGVTTAYEIAALAAASGTGTWAAAQEILNVVLTANPIGVVIAAIAALVAGVVYAYNNVEWFRGSIWAFWETIKFTFNNISTLAKAVFEHITTVANPLNWFKPGVMEQANQKLAAQMVSFGRGWGQAARKGYADGVAGIKTPDQKLEEKQSTPSGAPTGIGLDTTKAKSGGASAGGSHVTHITINVGTLGQVTLHAANVKEGADKMKEHIHQALLSVLNDANAMTTA